VSEYKQGYKEQLYWLQWKRLDIPAARQTLDLRTLMVERMDGEQEYNQGGTDATYDYIAALERVGGIPPAPRTNDSRTRRIARGAADLVTGLLAR
jgi:hypothetical protein